MSIAEHWGRIVTWLHVQAPATYAGLREGAGYTELAAARTELGLTIPPALKDWWSVCGGARGEVLPPNFHPYAPAEAVASRRIWLEVNAGVPDSWMAGNTAGSPAKRFHRLWVPIAGDGADNDLVVDLRPGPAKACVVLWRNAVHEVRKPQWLSLIAMVDSVATGLERNRTVLGYRAKVRDGELHWASVKRG
ncbi:hypothetical protein D5S17_10850 [Pseudonocardiaceae bacterium YIM PH 21723]|nr:hypothetical protein D5S17_10850 [Pseudonocardiaceae bacterium YIM PH 21723]